MIINLNSQTELSGFYLVYSGSTNIEEPGYRGLSHLSEHLKCRGIDHLQNTFQALGLNWNAYTSNNEVVFYMTGLQEQIVEWRDKFLTLITGYVPTEDEFNHEKKIVIEELIDAFCEQADSHYMNLDRKLYNYYGPIGSKEDLEQLSYENYIQFHKNIYSKLSKVINVTKDNPYVNEMLEFNTTLVEKVYAEVTNENPDIYTPSKFKDKTSIIWRSGLMDIKYYKQVEFLSTLLCDGLNSPIYEEIREKRGLVYHIGIHTVIMNNQFTINILTTTSNKNVKKLNDTLSGLLMDPNIITEERFNIIKQYLFIRKKKSDINRFSNVDHYVNNVEDMGEYIENVTYQDVLDSLQLYHPDNFYISTDKNI